MYYIYKTTDGIDVTGGIYKLLGYNDRAYVAAGVLIYSSGGSVFQLGGENRIDVAGQVVSLNNAIYTFGSASGGNIINVLDTGVISSGVIAINMAVAGTSVTNAGSITGRLGMVLASGGNSVINSGEIVGELTGVKLGNFEAVAGNYLNNTGLVAVSDQDGNAIWLDGPLGSSSYASINNSGTIVAYRGDAIFVASGLELGVTLNNSGAISGSIALGSARDEVRNSGSISDGVDLGGGDDLFNGTAGATAVLVIGGWGDDELRGGSGDDILLGGIGEDLIDGGAGFDVAGYSEDFAVIVDLADNSANALGAEGDVLVSIEGVAGGGGDDAIFGADGNESLYGGDGSDLLVGRAGNDLLRGGEGDDVLDGGAGNDRMIGDEGSDTADYASAVRAVTVTLATNSVQATGGGGRDRLIGIENLNGSKFDDTLTGDYLDNVLRGGAGTDKLTGGDGDDTLAGDGGDDLLNGGDGLDTADYTSASALVTVNLAVAAAQNTGGGGTDTLVSIEGLTGSDFSDTLTGNASANRIDGGDGNDTLAGGAGDDVLRGGDGTDSLNGGQGFDIADYSGAEAGVRIRLATAGAQETIGAGSDTLTSIEGVYGGFYGDNLAGNGADNLFRGGEGDDVLNGAGGTDTASYADAAAGVIVNLALTGAQATGGAGSDTLISIENLIGSAFADTLTGSAGDNRLDGGAGNDVLSGMGGNDVIVGSYGSDQLFGGDGIDTADYSALDFGIAVDLVARQVIVGLFNVQTVSLVETFIGTRSGDSFTSGSTVNTYTGGAGADSYYFTPGTATLNTITDFAGKSGDGDRLIFTGYGAGATFTQVDATHFQVSSSSHATETITFTNAPTINVATDVQFVG